MKQCTDCTSWDDFRALVKLFSTGDTIGHYDPDLPDIQYFGLIGAIASGVSQVTLFAPYIQTYARGNNDKLNPTSGRQFEQYFVFSSEFWPSAKPPKIWIPQDGSVLFEDSGLIITLMSRLLFPMDKKYL